MGDVLLENIFKKSKIIKSFNLENCKIQYQNIIHTIPTMARENFIK